MAEVKWTNQSIEDITSIAEYISKDSMRYAELFVEKVFERGEILNSHSHAGRGFLRLVTKQFVN
jgi:toxin ParE1/3/4